MIKIIDNLIDRIATKTAELVANKISVVIKQAKAEQEKANNKPVKPEEEPDPTDEHMGEM